MGAVHSAKGVFGTTFSQYILCIHSQSLHLQGKEQEGYKANQEGWKFKCTYYRV